MVKKNQRPHGIMERTYGPASGGCQGMVSFPRMSRHSTCPLAVLLIAVSGSRRRAGQGLPEFGPLNPVAARAAGSTSSLTGTREEGWAPRLRWTTPASMEYNGWTRRDYVLDSEVLRLASGRRDLGPRAFLAAEVGRWCATPDSWMGSSTGITACWGSGKRARATAADRSSIPLPCPMAEPSGEHRSLPGRCAAGSAPSQLAASKRSFCHPPHLNRPGGVWSRGPRSSC